MTAGVARVRRLASELAARVRYAQIVGRPVPDEQIAALVAAARLLRDHGEAWPHVVGEALHTYADGLDRGDAPYAAEPAAGGGVAAPSTRFPGGRREKRLAPDA